MNGHVEEMYGGHVVVKAFNSEARSMEKFECENEKLYNAGWKSEFLSGLMQPIMGFVGNLGYVVVCILGASMAAGGSMTIGGIQAFIQFHAAHHPDGKHLESGTAHHGGGRAHFQFP